MRISHDADADRRVERNRKSDHFRPSSDLREDRQVFVRAVWRDQRLIDVRRPSREIGAPPKRKIDIFGVCAADFPSMTRTLFDRQP
jgi:hypothetical protein